MNAPTLPDIREILDDLYHEIDNQSPPEGGKDGLFDRAHETMRWLLDAYLRRGEHSDRGGA